MKTQLPDSLRSSSSYSRKTPQLTITFPRNKAQLRDDLLQLKEEDSLSLSAFIVSCIEDRMGVYA